MGSEARRLIGRILQTAAQHRVHGDHHNLEAHNPGRRDTDTGRAYSITQGNHAGLCEKGTPFTRAFPMQSSGRNCSPAPDLVLQKLILPRVFSSGGMFFSQTPVWGTLPQPCEGRKRPLEPIPPSRRMTLSYHGGQNVNLRCGTSQCSAMCHRKFRVFRARRAPVFLLCPVIAFLECHTARAGGRPDFVEKHGCCDYAQNVMT